MSLLRGGATGEELGGTFLKLAPQLSLPMNFDVKREVGRSGANILSKRRLGFLQGQKLLQNAVVFFFRLPNNHWQIHSEK